MEEYKKKYPADDAVFLKRKEKTKIFFEKNEIKVETIHTEEMMILTENGVNYGEKNLNEDYFTKIEDIKAFCYAPEGNRFRKKEVKDFKRQSDVSNETFYDDGTKISFYFPGLVPGAKTEMTYKRNISEARFFGTTFIPSYIPVEEFEFSVEVPKNVTLNYKLFNADKINIEFTKEENKKSTVLTWKAHNVQKIKSENGAPSLWYTEPHLAVYITQFNNDGKDSILLKTPGDLYRWYSKLVKDVGRNEDPGLKRIVDSLIAGEKDEFEKVKKIFYWVQNKISYIAFEDGLGGFVPREAGAVCEKKFGDCKDMANLIYEMLNTAGIKAYRTWIGTRHLPYRYSDLPTPMVDNHMIATWIDKNGKAWFLDATGKNEPVDLYTSMIQGKEALVGISETEHRIITVPEVDKERNYTFDSIGLTMENGKIRGWGKLWMKGYPKQSLLFGMPDLNQEKQCKYMKDYLEKGNNKFGVDSVIFKDEGLEGGLEIKYRYNLMDYALVNKDEIYINLNLEKTFKNLLQNNPKREAPVEYTYKESNFNVVTLRVPDGYYVVALPPDVDMKKSLLGYKAKYKQEGQFIRLEYEYYMNTLLLKKEDFQEWNSVVKKIMEAGNESIILKKK